MLVRYELVNDPELALLRRRLVRILRVALLVPFLRSTFDNSMPADDVGSYGRDGTTTVSDIVNLRIATLTVTVSTLLLSSAAVVQLVEGLQWHEAFYFIVTTLTTVGFGDITPSTTLGELTVVCLILFGFTLIPLQVAQLNTLFGERKVYLGQKINPRKYKRRTSVLRNMNSNASMIESHVHDVSITKEAPNYPLR